MSQNRDAPMFPYYASNIIADKRYRLMTPLERFVWISIYTECWPNGSVPADPVELAKYLGYSIEDVKAGLTERVLTFFKEVKGELICPQLEKYWGEVLDRRVKQSEGGKKGAKLKRDKAFNAQGTPSGNPSSSPQGTPSGEPLGSLSYIKSSQVKSNQSIEREKVKDSFVDEMESTEAIIGKVKVVV